MSATVTLTPDLPSPGSIWKPRGRSAENHPVKIERLMLEQYGGVQVEFSGLDAAGRMPLKPFRDSYEPAVLLSLVEYEVLSIKANEVKK